MAYLVKSGALTDEPSGLLFFCRKVTFIIFDMWHMSKTTPIWAWAHSARQGLSGSALGWLPLGISDVPFGRFCLPGQRVRQQGKALP